MMKGPQKRKGGVTAVGDLIYLREGMLEPQAKVKFDFAYQGVALLLGDVGPLGKEWTMNQVLKVMGSIGFCRFQDVLEFLGEKEQVIMLEKFAQKYWGTREKEKAQDAPSPIVGLSGQPINMEQQKKLLKPEPNA
jgi:hypothetical protein